MSRICWLVNSTMSTTVERVCVVPPASAAAPRTEIT